MFSETHPTKVFHFCPRCGSANFPATSTRSFRCKQCNFELYINSAAAVAVILFNDEGKMLFSRRAIEPHRGKLDLPGGFVDPMESAEDAVRREIKEELGVEVSSMRYFCSFPNEYKYSGLSVFTTDLAFFAEIDPEAELTPMDDISSVEYYYPEEVDMNELPAPSMKNIVNQIIQYRKK